jgi:hypothetical protein
MTRPDVYVDPKADPTAGRCLWCGTRLAEDLPMPQCPVPEVHDHAAE